MPKTQVIQFFENGNIAHTRDRNLDLASVVGGTRSINRVTDILFDESAQGFYIKFLRGKVPNWNLLNEQGTMHWYTLHEVSLTTVFQKQIGVELELPDNAWLVSEVYIMFKEYEDAVAYEIELLNKLRKLDAVF